MGVVAVALAEVGAKGTVDEPSAEDAALGGATLTAEERAGDPADGIHALFDVDGEREEINAFPRLVVGRGGHEGFGVAHGYRDCAVGLSGELARRDDDLFVTDEAANRVFRHVFSSDYEARRLEWFRGLE